MGKEVSKYKGNSLASKKKHIFSRLFDYFSTFVVSYLLFTVAYGAFSYSSILTVPSKKLSDASFDAAEYIDSTHLQRLTDDKSALITIEESALEYIEKVTLTSAFVNDLEYPFKQDDGTYLNRKINKEETFVDNLSQYDMDNISYYFKKFKKEETSLNNYIYEEIDYKDNIDEYLYLKIMQYNPNYFINIDDPNYINRGEDISRYVVFNNENTIKMINRVAKGETIDESAVNLYNLVNKGYASAIQFGIKDVEDNSAPYRLISEAFNKAYQNITRNIALIYFLTFILSYILFVVIMRLICKEWVTIGQKAMGLRCTDMNEMTPNALNLIIYHLINIILFSTTSFIGFYFTGLFGVLSVNVTPHISLLFILLFILPINIISLFMPLFTRNHHDLSTLIGRIKLKDKNEFDAPVEIEANRNNNGVTLDE